MKKRDKIILLVNSILIIILLFIAFQINDQPKKKTVIKEPDVVVTPPTPVKDGINFKILIKIMI